MKMRAKMQETKNELNMTSMIDVVFLLLIFFVMTFKIVEMEGDFNIRMPLAKSNSPQQMDHQLPLKLRLKAGADGSLASMQLNESNLGVDFGRLQQELVVLLQSGAGKTEDGGPEIEIDADYNLRYSNVIQAITTTSGRKVGDTVVRMVEKIKFAPPRK
jgi:biopolymer transport protein ExbD